jgi:uncharacterized protein (TIGR03086 family)
MTEISDRYRRVAEGFTDRATAVPADAWDQPSPCEEWVARDVVAHLAESTSGFLGRVGVEVTPGPSAEEDPVGAWFATRDTMQAALDDPSVAEREYDSPMGRTTLERTVGMFGVGDVLVHTWDLARAVGLDDRLDPDEVHRLYSVMEPNDEMMRQGTAFGPKVAAPADADEQTRLIAFSGRDPGWQA